MKLQRHSCLTPSWGANLVANLSNVVFVDFTGFVPRYRFERSELMGMFGSYNFQGSYSMPNHLSWWHNRWNGHVPLMPINQLHLPTISQISLNFNITEHNATLRYIGVHQFIPGISSTTMADSLIIGQDAWVSFVGVDALETTLRILGLLTLTT